MAESIGTPWLWGGFLVGVLLMLALDLGVLHRRAHVVSTREALAWSVLWVTVSLLFAGGVYLWLGHQHALEFLTGYLIEKALSVDNIFVFLVIFAYFSVPAELQHRVLFWGVLGAIVLRAVFILAGAVLMQTFHWVIFLFGAFLVFTGIKILTQGHERIHPERNPLIRLFRRWVPTVPDYRGGKFFVKEGGRWFATPLLLVLLVVEATDVVFAIDSIPAIFAVTTDPFIVFTSNILAILGLRALYFLLAGMVEKVRYLKVGLGLVLVFVGVKMAVADWIKIPTPISLGVVVALLGGAVLVSLLWPVTPAPLPEHRHGDDPHAPPFPEEERPRGRVYVRRRGTPGV